MDGSAVEHSDSDSGESWTLLENSPTYGDEAPDSKNAASQSASEHVDLHNEKDEDTDGISIISDSEPESPPCEINDVRLPTEETSIEQQQIAPLISPTNNLNIESIKKETDFLGDNVKFKTYVHKRNPKVGSILDIIMLGTFVVTAGMALGHLWSCKNECTTQASVNKILSNLYKLQEENSFLRSKLKEITEATSVQLAQRKSNKPNKQYRCKKIFEEPVISNQETAIKCVDDKPDVIHSNSLEIPEHEKEFLNDINKMKNIYEQNKDWLDKEVKTQFDDFEKTKNNENPPLKYEKQLGPVNIPLVEPNIPDIKAVPDNVKTHKQINLEKQLGPTYYKIPANQKSRARENTKIDTDEIKSGDTNSAHSKILLEKKITYADSLKVAQPLQRSKRSDNNELPGSLTKDHPGKRKHKDDDILLNLNTFSEDDIKKDDRYTGPKQRYDKKKHDRQRAHKRQKRINKYEQWEMKGGYLKDFDEFSATSSQDNISINKPEKKFLNIDFENYINKLIEADMNESDKDIPKINKNTDERNKNEKRVSKNERKKGKTKDFDWYDQRTALRAEARSKLEQELFGENTSNNAAWYFRRMQKREKCRAKKDNSTLKKLSKRKMNFKMKR